MEFLSPASVSAENLSNSLNPEHNVGPDLDRNCLTL